MMYRKIIKISVLSAWKTTKVWEHGWCHLRKKVGFFLSSWFINIWSHFDNDLQPHFVNTVQPKVPGESKRCNTFKIPQELSQKTLHFFQECSISNNTLGNILDHISLLFFYSSLIFTITIYVSQLLSIKTWINILGVNLEEIKSMNTL